MKEIAKAASVGRDTVAKVKIINKAVEAGKVAPEVVAKLHSQGRKSELKSIVSAQNVVKVCGTHRMHGTCQQIPARFVRELCS